MSNNNINTAITNFANALSALVIAVIGDNPELTQAVSTAVEAAIPEAPQGYVQVTDRDNTLHFQMALAGGAYIKWNETSQEETVEALIEAINAGGDRVVDSLAQTSTQYLVLPVFNGAVTFPNAKTFALPYNATALLS